MWIDHNRPQKHHHNLKIIRSDQTFPTTLTFLQGLLSLLVHPFDPLRASLKTKLLSFVRMEDLKDGLHRILHMVNLQHFYTHLIWANSINILNLFLCDGDVFFLIRNHSVARYGIRMYSNSITLGEKTQDKARQPKE